MVILKIKIADEPSIIVSAIRHPFKVVLSIGNNSESISGIIEDGEFLYSTDYEPDLLNTISLLTNNKIIFSVEYSS